MFLQTAETSEVNRRVVSRSQRLLINWLSQSDGRSSTQNKRTSRNIKKLNSSVILQKQSWHLFCKVDLISLTWAASPEDVHQTSHSGDAEGFNNVPHTCSLSSARRGKTFTSSLRHKQSLWGPDKVSDDIQQLKIHSYAQSTCGSLLYTDRSINQPQGPGVDQNRASCSADILPLMTPGTLHELVPSRTLSSLFRHISFMKWVSKLPLI